MLKAVLFDMDDTLLDINLSAFIAVYLRDMAQLLGDVGRKNHFAAFAALTGIMLDLNNNARPDDDHRTNRAFFEDAVRKRTGVELADPIVADAFTFYEREVLPHRNDGIIAARPRAGALETIAMLQDRGLKVALLTNPSFSRDCIACRMRWGDLLDIPFELVTHMDNSTRCKPSPTYYLSSIERMELQPHEVLMVGNDAKRDFPTPDCGIQTVFVGNGRPVRATWCGSMKDFAASFDQIEERFYERQERELLDIVQDVKHA